MTDASGLLRAIWDQPHDDLPRLVYADWLDEHGDADRAAFIRMQCEHARTEKYEDHWYTLGDRIEKMWKKNKKAWQAELHPAVRRHRFERGFVAPPSKVYVAEEFIALEPELIAAAPTWKIELRGHAGDLAKAASHQNMSRVSELTYRSAGHPPKEKDSFFAKGNLQNISRLILNNPNVDDLTIKALVEHQARLPNLKQLQLGEVNRITDISIAALANSQLLRNLSHLLMPQCYLTADSFESFVQSRLIENCRCLLPPSRRRDNAHPNHYMENDITQTKAIVRSVGESRHLAELRALHLNYSHKDCSIVIFETNPAFELRELSIWTEPDTSASYFERMATWPGLQSLHTLIISPAIANVDAARLLAESPHLGQLKALGYYHYHMGTPSQRETIDQILLSRFGKNALHQPNLMRSLMD